MVLLVLVMMLVVALWLPQVLYKQGLSANKLAQSGLEPYLIFVTSTTCGARVNFFLPV